MTIRLKYCLVNEREYIEMIIEQLQLVRRNETSNNVLKFFSQRQRISNETNLESFQSYLVRSGYTIKKDDYFNLFQDLESVGAGKLVNYDGHNMGKFIWTFSLRDVSDQILNPNKVVDLSSLAGNETTPTRKRGRPKGYRPSLKVSKDDPFKSLETVYVFNLGEGKYMPLKPKEIHLLLDQINSIKAGLV